MRVRQSRKAPWIAAGSALAAAAGLAAIGLFAGTPSRALADVILQEAENLHGHALTYIVGADGKRTLADEFWLESNRARQNSFEPHGITSVIDATKGYDVFWNPNMHAFVFRDGDTKQQFKYGKAMLTGRLDMLATLPGFKKAKTKTGTGSFNGQSADYLELSLPNMRWIAYADPKSHRILGLRVFHEEGVFGTGRFVHRPGTRGMSFADQEHMVERETVLDNQVADPEIFKPVFKIDGVSVNAYEEREKVRQQLSHALGTYDSPDGKVVVRDVSMNAQGDVFVLWSGGEGKYGTHMIPVVVNDRTGGHYSKGSGFQATQSNGQDWGGFNFDGKPLQGAWFAHVDGPVTSGPVTIGFHKQYEPVVNLAFSHTQVPVRTPRAVPSYMMFMGMPLNPASLPEVRNRCDAEYFTDQVHDYVRGEIYWRKVIAHDEPDPSQRLPWNHFSLGICLERQKKYTQAIAELSIAKSVANAQGDIIGGMIDQRLRVTKREAGLKP